jgi:hypothetical protein
MQENQLDIQVAVTCIDVSRKHRVGNAKVMA